MEKPLFLTKSRYVTGLTCPKALWLKYNRPEELPETDEATQHRFDEGKKVGELAKSLFSDGLNISELNPEKNDKKSRALLKKRVPLFEAGFVHKNGKCYARADVLLPVEKDKWDIVEVKSATSVKEEYFHDISFQKYCYESAGLKIRKCFVLHINNQYVRQGKIEVKDFFVKSEVTSEIEELMSEVPNRIKLIFKLIGMKECPEFKNGEEYHEDKSGVHNNDKFWQENPDADILDLYRGGKKAIELFNAGILRIRDIPSSHKLNDKQRIQHKTHSNGNHHINNSEINNFISSLKYPLHFLDFETYNVAIPLYDGLKPYQQIPFQFSLHIIEKEGSKPKHISFIAEGSEDPRPKFLEELKEGLGTKGNLVIYNQSFEQGVLKNLAEYFPEYKKWVDSSIDRMVDLLIPFRDFSYYHPAQKGSASMKLVLPVLTGVTYEDFEIANGSQASLSYLFITHGSYEGDKATSQEIKKVRADLQKYCGQDTEGMISILKKLKELAK